MNKADLAEAIAKKTELSKSKAWETLNATFDAIKGSLKKGQKVSLVGFGSFVVRQRKARMGRNPKTGETIQIKARKVPAFSAGTELKSAVQ
ncbi:MAG: HU family DNA-binding protein [Candidatus Omnitrophica bacterium]|nr:HU family DNA-binding protein [Candidatus Omnitrophota bacterium]MDD5671865.1 HU family DNA-binding protein [Candidatus Omnitrophota bacterium]